MLISLKDSYKTFNFNNTLTYGEYFKLVTSLLKKLSDRVLEGDKIKLPFGTLAILKKHNDFRKVGINMSASMKLKKEIIARGGIPYEVEKDEEGNIVSDNGGEKYYVYFTEDSYFWLSIGSERKLKVGEHKYKFIPFRSFNYRRQRVSKNEATRRAYATY